MAAMHNKMRRRMESLAKGRKMVQKHAPKKSVAKSKKRTK